MTHQLQGRYYCETIAPPCFLAPGDNMTDNKKGIAHDG